MTNDPEDNEDNSEPVHPSRMQNFLGQYNENNGSNIVQEYMQKIGANTFKEFLDHEEAQNDVQQLVHQVEGHARGPAPVEDCDECDYLSDKHSEGAHGDGAKESDIADREHCWHCNNENSSNN